MDQALFAKATEAAWKEHDRDMGVSYYDLEHSTQYASCCQSSVNAFKAPGYEIFVLKPVLCLRELFQAH